MNTFPWYEPYMIMVVSGLIFALGWSASGAWHDKRAARRHAEAEAARRRAEAEAEARAPMPTCAGWLEATTWADPWGAQDRKYDPAWDRRGFISANDGVQIAWQPPDTVPMSAALDMAEAAYQLGQDRATADQVHAEAEAIWAEVEANPGEWQR